MNPTEEQGSSTTRPPRPLEEIDRNRVLLADDSPDMRALLRGMLERDGFEVIEAENGEEVLRRLGYGGAPPVKDFDLIISDVRMPNLDGLSMLARLRQLRVPTPVILITAFGDESVHERAWHLGAVMTLDKPFSLYTLRDVIRKLVDPAWW